MAFLFIKCVFCLFDTKYKHRVYQSDNADNNKLCKHANSTIISQQPSSLTPVFKINSAIKVEKPAQKW